jgi:hypothetical protein
LSPPCIEQRRGCIADAAQASTVIKHALDANLIRSADSNHPRAGYVPFWA